MMVANYRKAYNSLIKNVLIFFDGDVENVSLKFLTSFWIASTNFSNGYLPKAKLESTFEFWSGR